MPARPDLTSIVAGVALVAFGGVLLADAAGVLRLTFESAAPMVCALVGAILLVAGLTRDH